MRSAFVWFRASFFASNIRMCDTMYGGCAVPCGRGGAAAGGVCRAPHVPLASRVSLCGPVPASTGRDAAAVRVPVRGVRRSELLYLYRYL